MYTLPLFKIKKYDVIICEVGGTVGDIESLPFVEAIRQFSNEHGKSKTLFIHLTFVPFLNSFRTLFNLIIFSITIYTALIIQKDQS